MDGFTYYDIFATKGIEYIITIVFFISLLFFWIVLNKQKSRKFKSLYNRILDIPGGIYYSKNHIWLFLNKFGNLKIGLDAFLLQIIGNFNINYNFKIGDNINKGDIIAIINKNDNILEIKSPISGKIISVNNELNDNKEEISEDIYSNAWIFRIKPNNWKNESLDLLLSNDAIDWTKNEIDKFKQFTFDNSDIILQDGGEIEFDCLNNINKWEKFQNDFINI